MPSGPIVTLLLPLEPSFATTPRSCTYGVPVTNVKCAFVHARTRMYQSSLGLNCVDVNTKPSDPTRVERKSAFDGVGNVPRLKYKSASPVVTFSAVRHAPTGELIVVILK